VMLQEHLFAPLQFINSITGKSPGYTSGPFSLVTLFITINI
jgi:hypothetical protein